jgi:hypothetical protein
VPARDRFHNQVRNALIQDGWTITHDPLRLRWGLKDMFVDLGAERLLAAEKGQRKIAVEIKSFIGVSELEDLEQAIGQYVLYHDVLSRVEPNRELFLAVSEGVFSNLFEEPIGRLLLENDRVQLIVFDPLMEVIQRWIP